MEQFGSVAGVVGHLPFRLDDGGHAGGGPDIAAKRRASLKNFAQR